ncbi:MAG: hypothetical protein JSU68_02695 [Phycisphaerales bacterium]|nr:MAG: hypothetical protein JSU68_02695 [Phycisphaerales bacterium]
MTKNRRLLEVMLIIVVLGMAAVVSQMGGYKMVVLSLFFMPIVLSGYYLGRSSACVLALFSALAVTIAVAWDATAFAALDMPILIGLAIVLWAATLGLTAILVGTLCDERAATVKELHEAYVGVVEVLAKYLQSAHSDVKARSQRVAELSQAVAEELELSPRHVDNVRVAALLRDLGDVEITTKFINKAVAALGTESSSSEGRRHTFRGTDLVQSLGNVLHGAMPLLLNDQDENFNHGPTAGERKVDLAPVGARIIQVVRAYDALATGPDGASKLSPEDAVAAVRAGGLAVRDPQVVGALERVLRRADRRSPAEKVLS